MSWKPYYEIPHLEKPYPPKLRDEYGRGVYGPTSCRLDYASERAYQGWKDECDSVDRLNYKLEKMERDKEMGELTKMVERQIEEVNQMLATPIMPELFRPKNKPKKIDLDYDWRIK